MALTAGIVGLPNVGKSTLFNAITKAGAEAANYPFATIDPNVGMVEVPDERLQKLTELITPKKTVPTTFEFTDIAGIVKGASKGEGLGNKFLANIREVDAIVHVVRAFDDENVMREQGREDGDRCTRQSAVCQHWGEKHRHHCPVQDCHHRLSGAGQQQDGSTDSPHVIPQHCRPSQRHTHLMDSLSTAIYQ